MFPRKPTNQGNSDPAKNVYVVHGTVLNPNGKPFLGGIVRAFDRDLRREQLLGESRTDAQGYYEIRYPGDRFLQAEAGSADLAVRVFTARGQVVYEPTAADIVYNAPLDTVVDITLSAGDTQVDSEIERLVRDITPLLQDVLIENLQEDQEHQDITFLNMETGWPAEALEMVVVAYRIGRLSKIDPAFFYALLRRQSLFKISLASAVQAHFTVTLASDPRGLLYEAVLMDPEVIRREIKAAIAADLVPASLADQLDRILKQLSEFRQEAEEYQRKQVPAQVLNLVQANLKAGKEQEVIKILGQDAGGDFEGLISKLSQVSLFTSPDAANEAGTKLQLADLLGFDHQIVDSVRKIQGLKKPEDLRKLAALNKKGWQELLTQSAGQITSGGKPLDPKLAGLHASALVRKMEARYPTAAFAAQLGRDEKNKLTQRAAVTSFLDANPDFDLAATPVDRYFKTAARKALPQADAQEVKDNLKTVQRVFKLAPVYSQTQALLNDGLQSAQQVVQIGETQFVKKYSASGVFTKKQAQAAYQKAADVHTASMLLAAELKSYGDAAPIAALGSPAAADVMAAYAEDFPNLKNLFQLTDVCECDQCRSVHSAAAYLVDVLQFLKQRKVLDKTVSPAVERTAREVLLTRRPDIADIDLNCENTNTPLPYIDVVCELLEELVAPEPGIPYSGPLVAGLPDPTLMTAVSGLPFTEKAFVAGPDGSGSYILRDQKVVCKLVPNGPDWTIRQLHQTHLSPAELGAAPEYLNDAAYTTLQGAHFAFSLPFDLYHRESQAYLEKFDVARPVLMKALQIPGSPQDFEIAADALGFSDEERKLVVTPDAANQQTYWNTAASPASGEMQVVDTFLTRTGLDYQGLLDLLEVKFINPPNAADPNLELFIQHLDSSCDTTQKQIANLDDDALDRFHRFIRLWRKTGLGLQDLDRAVLSPRLGGGLLDDACLVSLNDLLSLAGQLSLSLSEAATLFGTLPDEDENARYYQVFLNKAALGTVEPHFLPAYVAQNELNELAVPGSGDKLSDTLDALALSLGLKPEEVASLIGLLPVLVTTPANQLGDLLAFAPMAGVYALAVLSHKLGLKISDLVILQSLTGSAILESPADALRFVEQAGKVKSAGIKPVDLRYLLEHQADDLTSREIKDSWVTILLESLQKEYQAAFTASKSPFDPGLTADENKGALKDILSRLTSFSADDLTQFMRIVDGEWLTPTGTVGTFIDDHLMDTVDTTAIKAAEVALAAAPSDGTRNAFIQTVLDALSAFFYTQAKGSTLAQGVMTAFKISESLTAALLLLAHLQEPLSAGGLTLAELLSSDDLVDKVNPVPAPPAVTPGAFPHQYETVRLLSVMAPYLATLPLKAEEVGWMLAHNADLGWLELDRLPYQAGITSLSFGQWEAFSDTLSWIQAYPPVANPADPTQPYTSYMYFETALNPAATLNDLASSLATLAGWDAQVVLDLDARFGLSVPDLLAYRLPATLMKLETAVVLLRRLGLGVADGVTLVKAALGPADTKLLRQALKQRYADADWLGVLKNIQDGLREEKRDALVAFILATMPDFNTANDLYETYLIDVEMSACQPTSRIVQAHGTLQLFVQRCLMGVEQGAVVDVTVDLFWEQWKWMKNYRVWEANRKIFLYPENWIEPDLRDDKSFFYKDVENALLQNELTDQAVEDAAVNYLENLDEIAFLDVCAVYYDAQRSEMHVFARTKGGDPATYYHRVFEQERRWTPWDKVDLDITGDHLLTFMRNSRLYLAWPVFSTQANTEQSVTIPNPTQLPASGQEADHPKKYYDVQIAISQYTGKKWKPKKLSKAPLRTVEYESLPAKENFRFTLLNLGAAGYYILCTYIDNGKFTIKNGYPTNSNTVIGSFSLTGCKGIPEAYPWNSVIGNFKYLPVFRDTGFLEQRFREQNQIAGDDLYMHTIFNLTGFGLVNNTPGTFKVTYPEQMSLIDLLLMLWQMLAYKQTDYKRSVYREGIFVPLGTLMPFFYGDSNRGYAIIPGFFQTPEEEQEAGQKNQRTFSDILKFAQTAVDLVVRYYAMWIQKQFPDFNALWEALVKDEDFVWLSEEFAAYQKLHFGHRFKNFYHPLVCYLREILYKDGIPALMKRQTQLYKTNFTFGPGATYNPTPAVIPAYPIEDLDFSSDGSYSSYNWELFFHLPFEIAVQLSKDQQFESAMEWFHYIFNPTGALEGNVPEKYWVTRPFYEHTLADYVKQRIDTIMNTLAADPSGSSISELANAVAEWRAKPFMPHVIARSRPVAYQKAVVMKYIQNLLDWGDNLFRQDTMESVNQATQMYVLAEKLLGPRPRLVPPVVEPPPETYNQLEPKVDLFGNALLELENLVPDLGLLPHGGAELPPPPLTLSSLYFCIPMNEQMLAVWDTVADRLFKIRNCQNIEGVERVLALFAPPIDPGALVRAAAAGLDISSILAGMNAPLPYYRFSVLSQKATELAQQVNTLGSGLLQALEKKDGEGLGLLRSGLEIKVLQAIKGLKTLQVEEAQDQIEALKKSVELTQEKLQFYTTRPYMNAGESAASDLNIAANFAQVAAMALDVAAGAAHLIPALNIGASGFGGSPHAAANWGGLNLGNSSLSFADVARSLAGILSAEAGMAATQGSYLRRKDDWDFQASLAQKELKQLDAQITAAQIRQQIAEKDLQNQLLQIENAQKLDEYMRSKYTNQELYTWMIGQISTVFFQAYKLATDVARKAERTYQHELGRGDTYIQFGYWDSMKKGLLSGERLLHDIKRLEVAYLDQNKREYELTRHFSLALLDPLALAQLKSTGACNVNLPEALFDLDYPGQYMRRIKAVSLSMPCVVGPYTTVGCKLSLVSNKYRKNTNLLGGGSDADKYKEQAGGDTRFVYNIGTLQSIATSGAQNDSGLFELNFRDDRYLPFEGAGAVGTWRIEMPARFRQFDPNTITDVVIHLKYTARDGGSTFRTTVENALRELLNAMDLHSGVTGLYRAFNLRQEFPEAWYQLKTTNSTTFTLGADKLSYFSTGHTPAVASASWIGRLTGSPATYAMLLDAVSFNLNKDPNFGGLCKGDSAAITLGTAFTLSAASTADLEDLLLVVKYTLGS